jgi:type VI secretion system protein ImpK
MSLEHWKIILETYDRVQGLLKKHLPVRPTGAKDKDKAPRRGPEDLQELQAAIVEELVELQRELVPRTDSSEQNWTSQRVEDVIRPLSYLFDETVLLRLSEAEQAIWPLVQKRLFLIDAGGDHFYEFADEKLGRADTPSLVFEVLHFCLSAGFQGNLELWPARVEEYKKKLSQRIPRPDPPPEPAPQQPTDEAPQPYEFPFQYYVATGFVIVCLPVVLWVLSN